MTEPTVRLRGLRRSFRGVPALAGLDLDLRPGVVGLLGPNGAGKTTLLRILATVLGAGRGTVRDPRARPRPRAQRVDDPPPPRLPSAGARLPPRLHGLRVRRLHGRAEGDRRPAGATRRGAPGAGGGRPADRRPPGSEPCPGGSGAASGWRRLCSGRPSSWSSTSRRPASTRSSGCPCGACWPRRPGGDVSSSPPIRPRTSPRCASASSSWTRGRALRRHGRSSWSRGRGPRVAGRRARCAGAGLVAHRGRAVPQPRRGRPGRCRGRRGDARGRLPAAARQRARAGGGA